MTALSQLVDTFSSLDPARWVFGSGATISTGRLSLFPGFTPDGPLTSANTARLNSGELWSVGSFDARGSSLSVETVAMTVGASGTVFLGVFRSSPRTDSLQWEEGFDPGSSWTWQLRAVRWKAGVRTVVAILRADPQSYRWVRIRESAGTAYWEVGADGLTWTVAASLAHGLDLSAVRVTFGAMYESPGDFPAAALFDNLNVAQGAGDPATITGNPGDPFLAVDAQVDNLTGTFVLDRSVLGGPDVLAWSNSEPGTWSNIVCDVSALNFQRGATKSQGLLTQTEAGTGTLTISDTRRAFDPVANGNAIHKGTPLRVRAWGYGTDGVRWDAVLLTAEVGDVAVQYLKTDAPVVTVTMTDLVGVLNAWESEGLTAPGTGAGDTLLQRVLRTLTTVGRGAVSTASDTAYTATLAPTVLAKPWQELTAAMEAELGRLWVDKYNRLVVRGRGSQLSGPVRGTLSDVHGEAPLGVHCCVADASVVYSGESMANRTLAGRRHPQTPGVTDSSPAPIVRRDHAYSQQRYGVAAVSRESLELQTDDQLTPWAEALIVAQTVPELRVDSVQPEPSPVDLDSALAAWPAVLQTDVGDRWLFRYHPDSGPAVIRAVGVLGISVDVTPAGWSITWTTEDAPAPGVENPTGWFVLGTSQLGGPDLLAPYGSPVSLNP